MNFIQPLSPISMAETSSYNTGNCMSSSDDDDHEEDMANCLIMLAHSTVSVSPLKQDFCPRKTKLLKIRSVTEMTGDGLNSGFECKTCNRVFPSFQALGGHRASHKKPKLTDERGPEHLINIMTSSPATYDFIQTGCNKNSKQPKVHECSICGSEFLSGQALGGHMRRHRAAPTSSIKGNKLLPEVTTSRNVIEKSPVVCLDLNFPPPEDVDHDHSSLAFASHEPHVVFSAASLVDCHY